MQYKTSRVICHLSATYTRYYNHTLLHYRENFSTSFMLHRRGIDYQLEEKSYETIQVNRIRSSPI